MIEIIHNILILAILFVIVYFIIFMISACRKKTFNTISGYKTRMVLSTILTALFIIQLIMALILGEAIVRSIICLIIWAVNILFCYLALKDEKKKKKMEMLYIMTFFGIYEKR